MCKCVCVAYRWIFTHGQSGMEKVGSWMMASVHPAVTCALVDGAQPLCLSSGGHSLAEEYAHPLRRAGQMFHGVDSPQAMRDGNRWVNTQASLPLEEVSMLRCVLSRLPEELELDGTPRASSSNPLRTHPHCLSSPPSLPPSPSFLGLPPKSTSCPKFFSQGCFYKHPN